MIYQRRARNTRHLSMVAGGFLLIYFSAALGFEISSFTGSTANDYLALGAFAVPPDTMGAVGPDHVMEFTNAGVTYFDKAGNLLQRTVSNDFWTTAGVDLTTIPDFDRFTDPRVVFDSSSSRWFAAEINLNTCGLDCTNNVFLAVSQDDNPLNGWSGFTFTADTQSATSFADYTTLGVTSDAVLIGGDDLSIFDVGYLWSIPKSDLLLSSPTVDNMTPLRPRIGTPQLALSAGTPNGTATVLGTGTTIIDQGDIFQFSVTGTNGPNAQLTPITRIPDTFTSDWFIPGSGFPARQPGGDLLGVGIGNRIPGNVVEIDDSLWFTRHLGEDASDSLFVQWGEIDLMTQTLLQSGTILTSGWDYFFPSIAVNSSRDVVIGFSGSSAQDFASALLVVGSDVAGQTQFSEPVLLRAGQDFFDAGRWGDYSATMVDPENDDIFWTIQEYVAGPNNNWGMVISQISLEEETTDALKFDATDNVYVGGALNLPSTDRLDAVVNDLQNGGAFSQEVGWNTNTQRMGFDGAPYIEGGSVLDGIDDFIAFAFPFQRFSQVDGAKLTLELTPKSSLVDTDNFVLFTTTSNIFNPFKELWGNSILSTLTVDQRTTVEFDLSAIPTSGGGTEDFLSQLVNRRALNFIYQDDALIHSAALQISGIPEPSTLLLFLIGLFGFGAKKFWFFNRICKHSKKNDVRQFADHAHDAMRYIQLKSATK